MDINLLLSPQETPRATPAPPVRPASVKKPRKPRTTKVNQPSPLAQTPLSPSAPFSLSPVLHPQNAPPNPSAMSPASSGILLGASSTSPVEAPQTKRQPSTPGMDT